MAQPDAPPGEIFDLGYRHYDGARLGRAGAVRALYVEGLRTVFGIGRGGLNKIPPIALIGFMLVPALVQAAITGLMGRSIQIYSPETYFARTVWIFALFCGFQTPELVSGDQQHRVLALYFSRAVLRSDYVLARIAALATSLFAVALLPHFIMLLGRWFAADAVWPAIRESLPLIPRILITSGAIALLLSTISLAIASLIKRGPIGTGALLGYFLLATAFVTPLIQTRPEKMGQLILLSPMYVGEGMSSWVFDTTTSGTRSDSLLKVALQPIPSMKTALTRSDTNAVWEKRMRRRRLTVVQIANLPGPVYLACILGYILLASGVLALRYRRIET